MTPGMQLRGSRPISRSRSRSHPYPSDVFLSLPQYWALSVILSRSWALSSFWSLSHSARYGCFWSRAMDSR